MNKPDVLTTLFGPTQRRKQDATTTDQKLPDYHDLCEKLSQALDTADFKTAVDLLKQLTGVLDDMTAKQPAAARTGLPVDKALNVRRKTINGIRAYYDPVLHIWLNEPQIGGR